MTAQSCSTTNNNNVFLADVLRGLGLPNKSLPSKYFYDDTGSRLFERICTLDEYYLTRTETQILSDHGAQIVQPFNADVCLIEPGAGAGIKAAILLNELHGSKQFVPLEISTEALHMADSYLSQRFPTLQLRPIHGDFTDPADIQRVKAQIDRRYARLVFFPGSTLGNFGPTMALTILGNLRQLMGANGYIVIGLDLLKDERRLLAAYDDSLGITAQFNKNLLERINRELDADFDSTHDFEHLALFNREHKRIEMHLRAIRDLTVTIAGHVIRFKRGETIHTENSHKYSLATIEHMAQAVNLQIDDSWTDHNQDFAVLRLKQAA